MQMHIFLLVRVDELYRKHVFTSHRSIYGGLLVHIRAYLCIISIFCISSNLSIFYFLHILSMLSVFCEIFFWMK